MLIDLPTTNPESIKAWCDRRRVSKLNASGVETPCRFVDTGHAAAFGRTHLLIQNPDGSIQQIDFWTAITAGPEDATCGGQKV